MIKNKASFYHCILQISLASFVFPLCPVPIISSLDRIYSISTCYLLTQLTYAQTTQMACPISMPNAIQRITYTFPKCVKSPFTLMQVTHICIYSFTRHKSLKTKDSPSVFLCHPVCIAAQLGRVLPPTLL